MPTNADHLDTVRTWQRWHVADGDVRIAEEAGYHAQAEERRAARDRVPGDPLRALHAAHALIESLKAEEWDMVIDARIGGASWEDIGQAVGRPTDAVRNDYTSLINYMSEHPPAEINNDLLDRYRTAL